MISCFSTEDFTQLIEVLKQKELTGREIWALTTHRNENFNIFKLERIVIAIGNHYPVYEPRKGLFKILTDNDISIYREELKNGKQ